jgi:hypothetical protein
MPQRGTTDLLVHPSRLGFCTRTRVGRTLRDSLRGETLEPGRSSDLDEAGLQSSTSIHLPSAMLTRLTTKTRTPFDTTFWKPETLLIRLFG